MNKIVAYVSEIQGNRAGDRSELVRVTADYESANILSSITFQVPIQEAQAYFIGQTLEISIAVDK